MTTTPRVSVVIPTYNYGHLLEQSLESVFAQTYKDYEVILVDDGSTDDTPGIAARYEGRIRYFRKENGGPSSARNEGIRQARGPLIAFLDSDDLWLPHKLAVQTAFADAHPEYGLVYCDMQHVSMAASYTIHTCTSGDIPAPAAAGNMSICCARGLSSRPRCWCAKNVFPQPACMTRGCGPVRIWTCGCG